MTLPKPLARYATLTGFVELARSLSVDPIELLRSVELDPSGLDLQDRWVPAASIVRLLELSAAVTAHQDFALRLAERRRLSALGPLSVAIRDEPNARSALRMLIRFQHTYNEALFIDITERDGLSTIVLRVEPGEPMPVRQATELAVAVIHQLLQYLLGDRWRPVSVCFEHGRPGDDSTHRRVFDAPLVFDGNYSGIVVYTGDLDLPNRLSDPVLRSYSQQVLDDLSASETPALERRVRELVELLLPTGRCSVDQVAASLGVDRRTVHRHLAGSGQTFTRVVDDTRAELAQRLVTSGRHTFAEISEMLSFSAPSGFSRWFTRRFGMTPREWRKRSEA
ncbi:AraC family transcriptional regulator [Rhodococcus sp. DMU2021]|uniref:AraC family transcriptional regulator n=1 Tax=Rhodococcus sp. DMU2021 TaxID=2866997 RepID=UPI001C7D959B|nr:AraC family transcriptional regulator [Rhodococcus sp. DMU2021]MBX4170213.1 AraC family transcriptional regulator [Rhodococcus sp. DMU2021]